MLNILTGRAGSGKTTKIKEEIINRLNNQNDDKNILLFVPDQMSFQAEYEIAKKVKGKTYSRLQVFSFKRLAYRLFLEIGGLNKTFINDMTVEMMITKIVEENRDRFMLYSKQSANFSFVQLLHDVLKEFKSYSITPNILSTIVDHESADEILKKKLHDIEIIFTELNQLYGNQLMDNEDFYKELASKIKNSDYIKDADIYIDGYHNFTTVECEVIYQMIKTSENVTMLFTIDDPTEIDMSKETHLFHLPYQTLKKMKNFALDEGIKIQITHLSHSHRFQNDALSFLEKEYETDCCYDKKTDAIKIIETENPTSEVHAVARMIYQDIFKGDSVYSDIVIYTNNTETYYPLIHNIFSLYDIPVFIDDTKLMLDHFLLNFIDAALEAVKNDLHYESIFRAIKTEVMMPLIYREECVTEKNYQRLIRLYRRRIDLLENYCLSHGIKGHDWKKDHWEVDVHKKLTNYSKKGDKEAQLEEIINETKDEIGGSMLPFVSQFQKANCVKEQVKAIVDLCENLEIGAKLDLYEQLSIKDGQVNEAKKHKQVYNELMDLFDELVEVCGEYDVSTDEFIKMLRTGFKGMTFAIIPPAIDQVMVGTLKRSRFDLLGHFDDLRSTGVKKAYVLGVNENQIPKVQTENGLLTNKEREFLTAQDIELMPTVEKSFLEEYFIIYSVLCSASEELILSYTLSTNDKKEAYPSEIIEKIKNKFLIKPKTIYDFPTRNDNNMQYITTKDSTTSVLLQAISELKKGYQVDDTWRALYGYYKTRNDLSKRLVGVTHENKADLLEQDDVKNLFGDTIIASVSSVEQYNNCPYAYFLNRGLKLRERDVRKIEAMDIGDLYHETLREITHRLINDNKALHEIPLPNLINMVNQIVDQFAEKMQRRYFMDNKKNEYLLYKIKQSLLKSIQAMHYQSQHSKFKTFAVEEKFGYQAERLEIQPITLNNGFNMHLKGFIDRIDVAEFDNTPYVRIIDYKSGNRDIDFSKVYHRLSLQLFTYLDVVLNNSKKLFNREATPAGVLYYHIQNSEIKADSELEEDEIEKRHHEQFKMNGYTLNEKEVSTLFDDKLHQEKKSDIVKVTLTNNGYHKGHSKVLGVDEINILRKYTRQAIVNSMEEMTCGHIDIKPVRYNKLAACRYCEYHSVCKFDANLRENTYHEVNKVGDSKSIIDEMSNELGGEKDE